MKLLLLLTFLYQTPAPADDQPPAPPPFPETCKQECVSTFGTKLGVTTDGIESYSNCKPKCVFANPTFVDKDYAGIQWQCVEFARRWLMKEKGLTFESIDVAADLWNKIDHLVSVKTKESKPLKNNLNGSAGLPSVGDLLVYAREYQDTGHVAIVLTVDRKNNLVRLGEQNFENKPWKGSYARTVHFIRYAGSYWLLDPYLIGWKSY